jgi:hypothetical protein
MAGLTIAMDSLALLDRRPREIRRHAQADLAGPVRRRDHGEGRIEAVALEAAKGLRVSLRLGRRSVYLRTDPAKPDPTKIERP